MSLGIIGNFIITKLLKLKRDFYGKYYDTKICNIEEEARVFVYSFGLQNREDLLKDYPVDFFFAFFKLILFFPSISSIVSVVINLLFIM